MPFLNFLGSQAGRVVRIGAGVALVAGGLSLGGGWIALAVIGLLPLAAGIFDFCLLGPLFRLPFAGAAFRRVAGRSI